MIITYKKVFEVLEALFILQNVIKSKRGLALFHFFSNTQTKLPRWPLPGHYFTISITFYICKKKKAVTIL